MLCSYLAAGRPLEPAWAVQEVFHAVYIVVLNKLKRKQIDFAWEKLIVDTVAAGRPAESALPVHEVFHVIAGRCNGFFAFQMTSGFTGNKRTRSLQK